jgi:hypothetical protein
MNNMSQSKTLWIGDVEQWMDEKLIIDIFDTKDSKQPLK